MTDEVNSVNNMKTDELSINHKNQKYPFSIVWTPIPLLTWLLPMIGHMGIAMSNGVIRDFAGSYYVSTDQMGFGKPTKYWRLDPNLASGGKEGWDKAVYDASEVYKTRIHNLCCDNCHSHVGLALNLMKYRQKTNWNMISLCFLVFFKGKYVGIGGVLKTWLPFMIIVAVILTIVFVG